MCLIALALGQSATWPLVLASNRDEFFGRPTQPLSRWTSPAGASVISGRDLEAGGTWLGASEAGRVALLTNVREPGATTGLRSRGELPLAWLEGCEDAAGFLASLDPQAYSGFNLVIGDLNASAWHWASNRQRDDAGGVRPGWQQQALGPGVYGLSNAFLDTPWPKTLGLKQALRASLTQGLDMDRLWSALADATPASEGELPDTGIPLEAERHLSSAWVRFPDGRYGTRASSLLVASAEADGLTLRLQEKTWSPQAEPVLREQALHWRRAAAALG